MGDGFRSIARNVSHTLAGHVTNERMNVLRYQPEAGLQMERARRIGGRRCAARSVAGAEDAPARRYGTVGGVDRPGPQEASAMGTTEAAGDPRGSIQGALSCERRAMQPAHQ